MRQFDVLNVEEEK